MSYFRVLVSGNIVICDMLYRRRRGTIYQRSFRKFRTSRIFVFEEGLFQRNSKNANLHIFLLMILIHLYSLKWVNLFLDDVKLRAQKYRTTDLIVPVGSDFRMREDFTCFVPTDKVIE